MKFVSWFPAVPGLAEPQSGHHGQASALGIFAGRERSRGGSRWFLRCGNQNTSSTSSHARALRYLVTWLVGSSLWGVVQKQRLYSPPRAREESAMVPDLVRTQNPHEQRVAAELEAQGYQVFKRGWPDFLAVRGDEVRLVEVKPPGGRLKPAQQAVADALARVGIHVEVAQGKLGPALETSEEPVALSQALQPGDVIAFEGPWFGQVVVFDQYGVRVTRWDPVVCQFCGWDELVPWALVHGRPIAGSEHSIGLLIDEQSFNARQAEREEQS